MIHMYYSETLNSKPGDLVLEAPDEARALEAVSGEVVKGPWLLRGRRKALGAALEATGPVLDSKREFRVSAQNLRRNKHGWMPA